MLVNSRSRSRAQDNSRGICHPLDSAQICLFDQKSIALFQFNTALTNPFHTIEN